MSTHRLCAVVGAVVLSVALLPAAAQARPAVKLRAVSAPPSTVEPGDAFTLRGSVRNTARKAHRTRFTVTLRTGKRSRSGRIVASKRLAELRANRARRYRLRVRVPAATAAGRYREQPTFPDNGARPTDVWLRSPAQPTQPGALSTDRQQAAATATWVDNRDQRETAAIANPDETTNPNRLVYLSPRLPRGVRISGRSTVTVRIAADEADAALGAMLVDYSDQPFERIDYRNRDGVRTVEDVERQCFGEASLVDNGCYLPVERTYTTTTSELVGRGAIDAGNRDSLWQKTALTPGQEAWVQIPLWGNDYTFLAGHRIGVVLVGTYRDYPSRPKATPAPTFTLNVSASRLSLPVVGGRDALGF